MILCYDRYMYHELCITIQSYPLILIKLIFADETLHRYWCYWHIMCTNGIHRQIDVIRKQYVFVDKGTAVHESTY